MGTQLGLFEAPPPRVRVPYVRGSDTSRGAAEAIRPHVKSLEDRVVAIIAHCGAYGATCDEVEMALPGKTHQCISARVNGAMNAGRIVHKLDANGEEVKRPTRSGPRFKAFVWVVAP